MLLLAFMLLKKPIIEAFDEWCGVFVLLFVIFFVLGFAPRTVLLRVMDCS